MHTPYHSYYAGINKIQKYIKTHPCYSHNRTIILPIREMFRSTKIHQNPPIKIALSSSTQPLESLTKRKGAALRRLGAALRRLGAAWVLMEYGRS